VILRFHSKEGQEIMRTTKECPTSINGCVHLVLSHSRERIEAKAPVSPPLVALPRYWAPRVCSEACKVMVGWWGRCLE